MTIVENIFKENIDKHAPYKEFIIKRPIKAAWMTDELLSLMDIRDKYKNLFNRFKDEYFLNRYKELKNEVNHKIRRAKIEEFNESINNKIKNSHTFHNELKKHNVVGANKSYESTCQFEPDLLNDTFCESHNAEVDFDKIARTINNINSKPKRGGSFQFQEVTEKWDSGFDITFMVSERQVILASVDGRGSAFEGDFMVITIYKIRKCIEN